MPSVGIPTCQGLAIWIFGQPGSERFLINGYREEGTTTTPLDMQIRNGTSRYHIVMQAVAAAGTRLDANRKEQVMEHYARKIVDHRRYINTHGEDPPEVRDWNWI